MNPLLSHALAMRCLSFAVVIGLPQLLFKTELRAESSAPQTSWHFDLGDHQSPAGCTVVFNDQQPAVAAIEIEPAEHLPVLFIIGDSTVCDRPSEDYNSWGQMITRAFKSDIVLANHGESGESYRSSLAARRFDKIFSHMKAGDFLIMQFGHNDMKSVDEASYANSIRGVVAK